MKRNFILTALTAIMAVSASAEFKWVTCVVCGKNKEFIDTSKPGDKDWKYHHSSFANGYICPTQDCQDQAKKWYDEDEKRARAFGAEAAVKIKNSKELYNAVRNIRNQEKYALLALKGRSEKQIAFMKQLVAFCNRNKCHAVDIWYVFAAYADFDAVKYFWPDPADEKVYLDSKKQMEANAKKEESGSRTFSRADMVNNFFASNIRIKPSRKNGPCALALGKNKKDNEIRFVESEDFAAGVLGAAVANDRKEVVAYLLKQTGGSDASLRNEIVDEWMTAVGETDYARTKIGEKIAELEKNRKDANDKFDAAKIDQQIGKMKKALNGMTLPAVSADTLSPVLSNMTPPEAARYFYLADNWGVKGTGNVEVLQQAMEAQSRSSLDAEVYAYQNKQKMYSALLSGGVEAVIELPSVLKSLNDVCAKSSGELGEWYKWREDLKKNWRAGVVDKRLPALVSGEKAGEWDWKQGVLSDDHPGKVSGEKAFTWSYEKVPSVKHPGYLLDEVRQNPRTGAMDESWEWTPGTPDLTRLGYFAGKEKDTFVWKPGIPDPQRIGMVTGAKEGEWVLAPGFQKQEDGTVRWVAGLTDPARPGIVSTEKMFCWIPDATHLWCFNGNAESRVSKPENPGGYLDAEYYDQLFKARNEDLDVEEERQVLHPTAERILFGKNR